MRHRCKEAEAAGQTRRQREENMKQDNRESKRRSFSENLWYEEIALSTVEQKQAEE